MSKCQVSACSGGIHPTGEGSEGENLHYLFISAFDDQGERFELAVVWGFLQRGALGPGPLPHVRVISSSPADGSRHLLPLVQYPHLAVFDRPALANHYDRFQEDWTLAEEFATFLARRYYRLQGRSRAEGS